MCVTSCCDGRMFWHLAVLFVLRAATHDVGSGYMTHASLLQRQISILADSQLSVLCRERRRCKLHL